MTGAQRIFKERIRATATLEEVFRAMGSIAILRIGRARKIANGLDPYAQILTRSVAAVTLHDHELNHPMLAHRKGTNRMTVLVVVSGRGMASVYSSSVLREAGRLAEELRTEGREPVLYVNGRRGESYYRFQRVEVAKSRTDRSDNPDVDVSDDVASTLLNAYFAAPEDGGAGELIVIYTRFISMVRQIVRMRYMLPLEVVEAEDDDECGPVDDLGDGPEETHPLFKLEPLAKDIFDALLPMYVNQHIYSVLLMAAALEPASHQQTIHSATENAQKLIEDYTHLADNACQAEITTGITEIVPGVDAFKQGA